MPESPAVILAAGLNPFTINAIGLVNRKDPVQIHVAIPAADPPDNITHD